MLQQIMLRDDMNIEISSYKYIGVKSKNSEALAFGHLFLNHKIYAKMCMQLIMLSH
jgi:hypothetical protein